VDNQYENITLYDYAVSFAEEHPPQNIDRYLTGLGWQAEDGLLVHSGSADVYAENLTKTGYLVVPAGNSLEGFVSLHDLQGNPIAMPKTGEVVLSNSLARDLDLQVGEKLHLRSENLGAVEVTLSAVCENYIGSYVYLSPQTYYDQLGRLPEYKTLYVMAHPGADPFEEGVTLSDHEDVSTVTINAADRSRSSAMLQRLDLIVIVVVVFAAALAFVVLYNLTNINITERVREIATVKVLGFYQNETAAYVFREMVLLCFGGGLVGLLMGKALHAFVMAQVDVEGMYFPTQVAASSYLIAFVLTMVFALLITTALRGRLKKIDMAESLKSIE
jgi:putative ABC transport system permease protein